MKRLLLTIVAVILSALPAHANIWHIRHDGGTATQCTGLTNAAYPGSGSGVACAYNHPFWMINQSTAGWASFTSGDTMEFDDPPTNTVPYYMGSPLSGGPGPPAGSTVFCGITGTVNCMLPDFPSGVNVFGQNKGSCHDANHTHLVNPTIFSSVNNVFHGFSVQNMNGGDIECIAVTQPDTCNQLLSGSQNGLASSSLSGGTASYVTFIDFGANNPLPTQRVNIVSTNNAALTLTNVNVASFSQSTWAITSSAYPSTTTATFGYTVLTGDIPRVGQSSYGISGLTNAGGQGNTSFGFYASQSSSITAASGGSSGTFTITVSGPVFTVAGSASESGSGLDFNSGVTTVTGVAGSVANAADTGTIVPTGECVNGVNNYGQVGIEFEFGTGQGPANLTMKDVAAVGLKGQGILGSHANVLSTDVNNFSDIYIIGNATAGWDSDGGGCGVSCESVGTNNLSFIDIEWNGCMAVKPYNFNLPASGNTFDLCFGQSTGLYGDGYAAIAAADNLNVDHLIARYNTQDGFDSVHHGDDISKNPNTTITNSISGGNGGQTFKMGAGGASTAIGNYSSGNCRFLFTTSNAPSNPLGWAAGMMNTTDTCRASGDEWAFGMKDGQTVTLENNTSTGQGATMYDFETVFGASCTTGCVAVFRNNSSMGFVDPVTGQVANGFFFGIPDPFANAGSLITHNNWWSMRGLPLCLQDPHETNCTGNDPLMVSESNVDTINPNITSGSPLIHAGVTPAPSTDFNGNAQTSPPVIGAFVLAGTPTVATPTPSPAPGAFSSTQSVTLSTATSGATICYTTNGTTPAATTPGTCDVGSTTYSGAITVATTTTIKALGTLSGDLNSSVFSGLYTITPPATPTATFSGTVKMMGTVHIP